jgi:hypothetical protein
MRPSYWIHDRLKFVRHADLCAYSPRSVPESYSQFNEINTPRDLFWGDSYDTPGYRLFIARANKFSDWSDCDRQVDAFLGDTACPIRVDLPGRVWRLCQTTRKGLTGKDLLDIIPTGLLPHGPSFELASQFEHRQRLSWSLNVTGIFVPF